MEKLFNLECPINRLSLGQVSFGVLHELYSRDILVNLFPIGGNVDLAAFDFDDGFQDWLDLSMQNRYEDAPTKPSLTIWHIDGSHKKLFGTKNVLWTAHETDQLTNSEVAILNNYDHTFVTSDYSLSVFNQYVKNVSVCPNYFDSRHFFNVENVNKKTESINFGLFGKLEKRKLTLDIIILWAKIFGNNPKFSLNCGIFNHHISPQEQQSIVAQHFGGKIPWNINFLPFQEKNSLFNLTMNSIDIDLSGLSGAEGWNLPAFQALCLGKVCVFLNAHAHKTYLSKSNVIKVSPSGKAPIYDSKFFIKGHNFNQGNMFIFNEKDAADAMKQSVEELLSNKNFEKNCKIADTFSVKNTVDTLLEKLV